MQGRNSWSFRRVENGCNLLLYLAPNMFLEISVGGIAWGPGLVHFKFSQKCVVANQFYLDVTQARFDYVRCDLI